jgi:hypothetical protein
MATASMLTDAKGKESVHLHAKKSNKWYECRHGNVICVHPYPCTPLNPHNKNSRTPNDKDDQQQNQTTKETPSQEQGKKSRIKRPKKTNISNVSPQRSSNSNNENNKINHPKSQPTQKKTPTTRPQLELYASQLYAEATLLCTPNKHETNVEEQPEKSCPYIVALHETTTNEEILPDNEEADSCTPLVENMYTTFREEMTVPHFYTSKKDNGGDDEDNNDDNDGDDDDDVNDTNGGDDGYGSKKPHQTVVMHVLELWDDSVYHDFLQQLQTFRSFGPFGHQRHLVDSSSISSFSYSDGSHVSPSPSQESYNGKTVTSSNRNREMKWVETCGSKHRPNNQLHSFSLCPSPFDLHCGPASSFYVVFLNKWSNQIVDVPLSYFQKIWKDKIIDNNWYSLVPRRTHLGHGTVIQKAQECSEESYERVRKKYNSAKRLLTRALPGFHTFAVQQRKTQRQQKKRRRSTRRKQNSTTPSPRSSAVKVPSK